MGPSASHQCHLLSTCKRGDTFLSSSRLPCLVPQSPWIQAFAEMKNTEKIVTPVGAMGFGKTSMDFGGFSRLMFRQKSA